MTVKSKVEMRETRSPEVLNLIEKEVVLSTGKEWALCSNVKLLAHRFIKTHQYVSSATYCGVDFEEGHLVAYYDEDEAECQKFYF